MLRNSMKKKFYILGLCFVFFTGCGSDTTESKTVETYSSFKIATIKDATYDGTTYSNVVYPAFNDNYMAAYVYKDYRDKRIVLYEKSYDSVKIVSSVPKTDIVHLLSIALNNQYLALGNYSTNENYESHGNVFVYKIEENATLTKVATVIPEDTQDNWNKFGKKVLLDKNKMLVSSEENTVYLFDMNEDGVWHQTAKMTMPEADMQSYFEFGLDIAMDGDMIAIGAFSRERNEIIYLYHIEDNATVSLVDSVDFAYRGYFNHNIVLKDGYLATSENYNNLLHVYKITNNTLKEIAQKELNLLDIYTYNYLSIDQGYIYATSNVNEKLALSIFKIDDEKITNISDIAFDFALPSFISSMKVFDNNVFIAYSKNRDADIAWYNLDAKKQVYLYDIPPKQVDIGEGNSFLYSFEAASPVGDLSYLLGGDDSSYFTMDENNVTNAVMFDYEHPLDSNGDNNYSFTVTLQDPEAHQKVVPLSVVVHDKKYIKENVLPMEAKISSIASYGDYIVVGLSDINRVEIYKIVDGVFTKISEVTPNEETDIKWFGGHVAIYGDIFLVSSSNQGVVYLYKIENDSVSLIDTLSESNAMDFGTSLAITQDKICIGSNIGVDRDRYSDGTLYLYKYDDTNVTKIAEYTQPTDTHTYYANVYNIVMNDKYILTRSSLHVHLNKLDTNGSISEIAKLSSDRYNLPEIALKDDKAIIVSDENITIYSIDANDSVEQSTTYTFEEKGYIGTNSLDFSNDTLVFCKSGKANVFHLQENDTVTYVDELNKYDSSWYCGLVHLLEDGNITASSYYGDSDNFFFYIKDKEE